jgi:hypothetical protein
MIAVLAVLVGLLARLLYARRNPLVLTVAAPVQRLTSDGRVAHICRVRATNPDKALTVEGVRIKVTCTEQPTHPIALQSDDESAQPYTFDPEGDAHIRVIAQVEGEKEWWFAYEPKAEPFRIRKRLLNLQIHITATKRTAKKLDFCVSEDGAGNIELYSPRLPPQSA